MPIVHRRSTELRRIGASEFVKRLKQVGSEPDRRYAFFLGAGCSITSGIPAAGKLVRDSAQKSDWLRRLRDVRSPDTKDDQLDEWARKELTSWNPTSPAASYGELIELLFLTAGDRQREIERLCDHGIGEEKPFPRFGYAVLSGLMCQKDGKFNVSLTTNFDDLLADAFFFFQEERPLVIHHDSLAPFIRPTHLRPLIAKLHGDHRLAPRNTSAETESLADIVAARVSTVLHDRGLIFLGYGGNDESIVSMMENLPEEAIPFGVYWVSGTEPRGIFRPWLESRRGIWVEHQGFDEMMLLFKQDFAIPDPDKGKYEKVHAQYLETQKKLESQVQHRSVAARDATFINTALAQMLSKGFPDLADKHFLQAIQDNPNSSDTLRNYANFLIKSRKDMERAEEYFKRAIDVDPKNASNLGDYATFLVTERKDMDRAEEYFKRAIDADPNHASNLGNYAIFLSDIRKDTARAEEYFKRAIDADPNHASNLSNFAMFLMANRKELERVENYFKRAVDADPKHATNLGNYATFLIKERNEIDGAEEYFKRAIEADPKHANNLGNYALLLSNFRRDIERSEAFYKRALEADPKHAGHLANYASFLMNERQDMERAEEYFKRAIDADPKHADSLGNYATFLMKVRKDVARAEEYFKRAIDADPSHANNLGNYAFFLTNCRNDTERAEEFYKRAIDADPKHVGHLGNYALFLQNVRKDIGRAEEFYKQAIYVDPKHANHLGNYAGMLLGQGKEILGSDALKKALAMNELDRNDDLAIELAFYSYAHGPAQERNDWLKKLKALLEANVRSLGWNFDANVQAALRSGHPAKNWLKKLAAVISGNAELSTLGTWRVWQHTSR